MKKEINYKIRVAKIYSKKPNFILKDQYDKKKIIYILLNKPFSKNSDRWQNQASQRDFILKNLDFASPF